MNTKQKTVVSIGFRNCAVAVATLCTLAISPAAHATKFMTQQELLATIPGHAIHGISRKGNAFVQVYSKGKKQGTLTGKMGDQKYAESWFVSGNHWCENWGSGHACWQVVRKDANTLQMYRNGKPIAHLWHVK